MSYLSWKEIVFNKQEARNAFVALVDYNMNGKTKHYDGMTYLFRKLYPDKRNEYLYDIVELDKNGANVATYHLRLDEIKKKIYLKAFDYNLRTELFFDIILNNIKEILANQTCFALDISNSLNSPTNAFPHYEVVFENILYHKAISLSAYGGHFHIRKTDFGKNKSNCITIEYTKDRKYAYVSISKNDKLIDKRLKRYFLYLYINYIKAYKLECLQKTN